MPVSVCKEPSADASALQYIFDDEDGGPSSTCGIMAITKHDSGAKSLACSNGYVMVTEGELSLEDAAKPGHISILKPGNVIHIDKGTNITWSSRTSGKAIYVGQYEYVMDQKKHIV